MVNAQDHLRRALPRLKGFDHTLAFFREGYLFISQHCDRLGSDGFAARIMLTPVVCMRGSEAAEVFYGQQNFTRRGALPPTTLRLLQDKGSVQQLDGPLHRHRKKLFLELLLSPASNDRLVALFRDECRHAAAEWPKRQRIVLLDEMNLVITRSICRWAGVPLDRKSDHSMASELAMMITGAGRVGPAALLALWRRRRTEIYIAELVQAIRSGQAPVAPELPAAIVANYRDLGGAQLSVSAASVEILNLLRPSVAVARFIVFAALALEENPEWREQLRGADDAVYDFFAEEVRRLYPFFPVIGGRVLKPFEWKGHHFREKDWVLLDLYGTDHDPGRFPDPDAFDPGRRLSWRHQDYSFVPQGGGDARCDHRCPGEQFTIVMIREAMRMLVEDVSYRVPDQNLSVPLNKMPTAPVSGYILTDITLQSD